MVENSVKIIQYLNGFSEVTFLLFFSSFNWCTLQIKQDYQAWFKNLNKESADLCLCNVNHFVMLLCIYYTIFIQ